MSDGRSTSTPPVQGKESGPRQEPNTHPDIEFDILIRHGLDVEPDCGDGSDGLVELELV